jgi:hypothetical protein
MAASRARAGSILRAVASPEALARKAQAQPGATQATTNA